ncbi:MAG: zinc-dependent metalloprotease [Acidimicrobiales bacterium]
MDESDPPEQPFGLPFFGDLSGILGGMGDGGWTAARQMAFTLATEGTSEPNVDPEVRMEIEQLARVAELRATDATGLSPAGGGLTVTAVTRTQWVDKTLDAYKPLFKQITDALGNAPGPSTGDEIEPIDQADQAMAMFGQMMAMLGPMMLSMTAGSMVGHMGRHSLGQYDIPVPRSHDEILIMPANLDEFGEEWSLDQQDLRLWVCLHEITHHLVLGVPHVGDTLRALMLDYAGGFRADPTALEQRLGALDLSNPEALTDLQSTLGDPEVILGAIQSPAQRELLPRLQAVTAVVVGVVDYVMDSVGETLLGSYDQLTEALRRRRVEADPSDRFIERMLGLELTQDQYDRGASFVTGVVERAGAEGLARLWESETNLPTPNEVDAPGLWLARIDLPA